MGLEAWRTRRRRMVGRLMAKRSAAESQIRMVREQIQDAWEYDRDNRREAAKDLDFLAGNQWPESVRRQREAEGRPMLTINRLPQFVHQVTNDIRQADLAIKASPVDDNADVQLAKIYNGLLRQIQYHSSAPHVYSSAAAHQVACGIGWWRIVSQYADDMSWDQELKIKLIKQPMSVYWDPGSVEVDRSDAMWIAVTELIPKKAFEAKYPKASTESMDVPGESASYSTTFWTSGDFVRVAEFWQKVPYKKKIGMTQDGQTIDLTDIKPDMMPFLPPLTREREVDAYRIEQFLCSGADILTDTTKWLGKYIPIIPAVGDEIPLENITWRGGLIRHARDPQQLYNFYRTATAEAIALAPKAPYLATPKQIAKFKGMWDTQNTTQRPYLLYEPDAEAGGPPKREHPPELPSALMQEAQIAADDMKATTGIYDAALGARSNEQSGRAIMARQQEGDVANFHYADNLERALEHTGRVLIDLIPKIYDNERVIRLMGEDGTEEPAVINQVLYGVDGMPVMVNDLSAGRFDVRVSIGPSYSTKRMEAAEAMMQFLQAYPAAAPAIADLVVKNSDWAGADEIAKRLKNMVPPELLNDPEDPNAQNQPPPEPDPMQQLQMAGAQKEVEKVAAEVEKIQADTMLTKAKIAEIGAKVESGQYQATADKTRTETELLPHQQAQKAIDADRNFGLKDRQQQRSEYESDRGADFERERASLEDQRAAQTNS